jgi:uncharacterized protein YdcH (DUF465 family)
MKERTEHLIERFPEHETVIRSLSESDARFQDLLSDHYDLHQKISRGETEADPDAEARYRNLEEELVRLIQAYPLA